MDEIDSLIQHERPNLASNDKLALRDAIKRLEKLIQPSGLGGSGGGGEQQPSGGPPNRSLLLRLIKISIELQNTDLLMILVAQLKLVQVALVLRSTLQLPNDNNKLIALSRVADHFHIEHQPIREQLLLSSECKDNNDCDTLFNLKSLVNVFIETNEWKKANEIAKRSGRHGSALNRIISLKLAQQYEAMENFYEAMVHYETSGTEFENSFRVIIKQFLDSSRAKLEEYCFSNPMLKNFWSEYSLFCTPNTTAATTTTTKTDQVDVSSGPEPAQDDDDLSVLQLRSGLLGKSSTNLERKDDLFDSLPDRMRRFLNESSNSKQWSNRRTLEGVISNAASLDSKTRRQLAIEALHYLRESTNNHAKACALCACLGESGMAIDFSSSFLGRSDTSRLSFLLNKPEMSAAHLIRYLRGSLQSSRSNGLAAKGSPKQTTHCESVYFSALNLGLLDEALRCFCQIGSISEDTTDQILERLENLVAARHSGSLDRIDPRIQAATLSMLRHNLISDRIPPSATIAIVTHSMTIFIYKLDSDFSSSGAPPASSSSIHVLESMFEFASSCIKEVNFNATNSVVRSASAMVTAIKDKLEIVSDSDRIRLAMRDLVESVASRCLVESQFKQAAMLYSQMEDNVNAIKCLMRLGDLDTVMNYSLLVRDITVNRLTINYLRHLDVDSKTIEDFIAKSRQ